jgi:hypothetical protein
MEKGWLYMRPVKEDTETPRECYLQAMYSAYKGEEINPDVYEAVLNSASLRKENLKAVMDNINELARRGVGKETSRMNMAVLAGAIVVSYGINGPEAAKRKLDHLGTYFMGLLFVEEFGGQTE